MKLLRHCQDCFHGLPTLSISEGNISPLIKPMRFSGAGLFSATILDLESLGIVK